MFHQGPSLVSVKDLTGAHGSAVRTESDVDDSQETTALSWSPANPRRRGDNHIYGKHRCAPSGEARTSSMGSALSRGHRKGDMFYQLGRAMRSKVLPDVPSLGGIVDDMQITGYHDPQSFGVPTQGAAVPTRATAVSSLQCSDSHAIQRFVYCPKAWGRCGPCRGLRTCAWQRGDGRSQNTGFCGTFSSTIRKLKIKQ